MEEEDDGSPGVYRPSMEVEENLIEEKFEQDQQVEELPDTQQQCEAVTEMDDSQLLEISPVVTDVAAVVVEEGTPTAEVEVETEEAETTEGSRGGGRRKRGRQPRVQTKAPSKKKEEEDVCFICFDGGNLVLCDRRGCPKAYHPACVNRDESFFRSKGRWNCGWEVHTKREFLEEGIMTLAARNWELPFLRLSSMPFQVGKLAEGIKL